MKNQFFYTRKEISGGTPEAPEYKEFRTVLMLIR
jgi:hypothetical protein